LAGILSVTGAGGSIINDGFDVVVLSVPCLLGDPEEMNMRDSADRITLLEKLATDVGTIVTDDQFYDFVQAYKSGDPTIVFLGESDWLC
jgi:hypothetical protein